MQTNSITLNIEYTCAIVQCLEANKDLVSLQQLHYTAVPALILIASLS
jgi:hypothetical protein